MIQKLSILTLAALMSLVFLATPALAQPVADIKIEGYSPQEIHDLGYTSARSTGLQVVGIGQIVYLIGSEAGGGAVNTYAWTLAEQPAGSAAVLDSADTEQITFKSDVAGKYKIQLVVTTADGMSEPVDVTITAATFVGSGGLSGLPINTADGQCGQCHSTNFNQWLMTGHSDMFTRAIDGLVSSHYNESCIECHTTGFDHDPTAVNGGFDDVQDDLGWMFPADLVPGNWDSLVANFPELAAKANIQCESCHGPGSLHKGDKTGIAMSLDEAACGYCHEEEPYHRRNTQWKSSGHAIGVGFASTRSSCAPCHSGWGFIRRIDPRPNDSRPELGFAQVSCAVCHDPHRAELDHQVRSLDDVTLGDGTVVNYGGNGKLCMQCHISRRDGESYASDPSNLSSHFGPHGSNQADMLDGTNAIEYGLPIGSSGHKFAAADACVTCHMQATTPTGDPAHDEVGDHSFAMSTVLDDGMVFDHVAVCQDCHGAMTSFDDIMAKDDYDQDNVIESTQHEIEGMLERLGMLLPPIGDPEVNTALEDYDWTVPDLTEQEILMRQALTKAAYNYRFVEEDGSHGVHNAGYSIALLRRSIASLTTGDVGAGEIISITDVPNDQGKQVRIGWWKFAGDGMSVNPITGYSLWRRVDEAPGKNAIQVGSKESMLANVSAADVGKRYAVSQGSNWDFVGWLPAEGRENYSTVVPTLFDSTAEGMYWSVFFVSAQARTVVYESTPDSGYSVDNLIPSTPANINLAVTDDGVEIGWDDPIDPDFRYFAVYRSTTSGFDPGETEPFATLISTDFVDDEVEIGTTYYYRLSTFDFSGNESDYSLEMAAIVTSVDERPGLPTEFALQQNYPNPFNPETAIEYHLPAPSHVRLTVFNSLGHEIRTLVDEPKSAARHIVLWDGYDNDGHVVPSGVYFYRIEAEDFSTMKKMVMMK